MAKSRDIEIRVRANHRCEYCLIPEDCDLTPFQIDHVIAQKHGGTSEIENLALACLSCNSFKGPNIAGVDAETRQLTRLFHPRTDDWAAHFRLHRNGILDGKTSIGRATVQVLNMNSPVSVALRSALIVEGRMIAAEP